MRKYSYHLSDPISYHRLDHSVNFLSKTVTALKPIVESIWFSGENHLRSIFSIFSTGIANPMPYESVWLPTIIPILIPQIAWFRARPESGSPPPRWIQRQISSCQLKSTTACLSGRVLKCDKERLSSGKSLLANAKVPHFAIKELDAFKTTSSARSSLSAPSKSKTAKQTRWKW